MYVPFFSTENNLQVIRKMKVIFLIKQIRTTDILIFIFWILPCIVNFVFFNLISGDNSIAKVFYPFGSLFKSDAEFKDWSTWYGAIHMSALLTSLLLRVILAVKLYKKMKIYQQNNKDFKWEKKSKFWLVIFLPFISFVVYSILSKMSKFELMHKYNL